MKLANKTHYGLQMLTFLAEHPGEWFALPEIARELSIPVSFLKHIAAALRRDQIVDSQGGIRGGYRFNRATSSISLAAILVCLGEPIDLLPCRTPRCQHARCRTGQFWATVSARLEQAFVTSTLETVLRTGHTS